jgi:hypothetical protein
VNVDYRPAWDRDSLWLRESIGSQDPYERILARFSLKVLENMVSRPDVVVLDAPKLVKFGAPNPDDFFDSAKALGQLRAALFFSDAFLSE